MSSRAGAVNPTILEKTLKRDKTFVLIGVAATGLATWAYTLHMSAGAGVASHVHTHSRMEFLLKFWMWAVMMIAMMLPAVTPTVLLVADLNRRHRIGYSPLSATFSFLTGYLFTWILYSALAALGQVALHNRALLRPHTGNTTPLIGGIILLIAGMFQSSPWKNACLRHCRSPIGFLMTRWEAGVRGGIRMGIRHGLYCIGCCWALMLLMFVGGIMNPWVFLALAGIVLAEKALPRGVMIGRLLGGVMFIWGLVLVAGYFWQ